jgi:methionine-rich copper-binding protein CopC
MKRLHTGRVLPLSVCLPLPKKSRRVCIVILGAVLLFCVQTAPVFAHTAHAILLHSTPQDGSVLTTPPTMVQLWFSEPVQIVD